MAGTTSPWWARPASTSTRTPTAGRTWSGRCTTSRTSPAPADDTERLAVAVTSAFRGYAGQLRGIGQEDPFEFGLPSDPELLSYLVAAAMQVETAQRQRLLEIDGTAERLTACLRLLRREAALLDRMLVRSKDHAGTSSLN